MTKLQFVILFLILNFMALGIGSWLMDNGPNTQWYLDLNKAPWTPPGWLFGVAWTTIMICFSLYMAYLFSFKNSLLIIGLYTIQFLLNISWNYIFFNKHLIGFGFIIILLLTLLVAYFLFRYGSVLKSKTWLIVPYFIWLLIASSLNGYIYFYN